jgi:hypothetical protein
MGTVEVVLVGPPVPVVTIVEESVELPSAL